MTNIHDFALQDRQLFIAGTPTRDTMAQKRIQAITYLGKRYVLHPANRVQKLAEPLPEVFAWRPATVLKARRKAA